MSRFIPTPFNFNMNAEEKVLEDMKLNFDSILSPDESDSQYDNFNSDKGLLDIAKKGTLYGGTTYGAALGIRHGLRYATPITQRMAAPLEQASTRIEGYYKPGVGYKDKVSLLMEHWKKGGTPALTEYLEKYKNTPDPFGQTYSGGATPKNLDKLRQGISGRGGLFGLPGAGVQTSDEFFGEFLSRPVRSGFVGSTVADFLFRQQQQILSKQPLQQNPFFSVCLVVA